MDNPLPSPAKIGLILTGGGARAAYQVGFLRAVSHLLPRGTPNPFTIICGTSAGAINAALFAAAVLANKHPAIRAALNEYRSAQTAKVMAEPDPRNAKSSD